MRLVDDADGLVSTIDYEHWRPEVSPPDSLFVPDTEQGSFIDRLSNYLEQVGLGSRIGVERKESDARALEWEERISREQNSYIQKP